MSILRRGETGKLILDRPEYYVQTGSMFENPYGVPHDEIVRMILENPPETTAQTVFGKYVESSGLVFTGELIQMLFDRRFERVLSNQMIDTTAANNARLWFYRRQTDVNTVYYTGVDLARQTDYTVIFTIDVTSMPAKVVYYKRVNRVPWESIYAEIGYARQLFGPNILFDGTGPGGDVVGDALESRVFCPMHRKTNLIGTHCSRNGKHLECNSENYLSLSCCDPFHFTGTTKKELVEHLRNILSVGYDSAPEGGEFGWLRSPPIPALEDELAFYTWDDKRLQTDCLFGLALAVWNGLEDPVGIPDYGSVYGRS